MLLELASVSFTCSVGDASFSFPLEDSGSSFSALKMPEYKDEAADGPPPAIINSAACNEQLAKVMEGREIDQRPQVTTRRKLLHRQDIN